MAIGESAVRPYDFCQIRTKDRLLIASLVMVESFPKNKLFGFIAYAAALDGPLLVRRVEIFNVFSS